MRFEYYIFCWDEYHRNPFYVNAKRKVDALNIKGKYEEIENSFQNLQFMSADARAKLKLLDRRIESYKKVLRYNEIQLAILWDKLIFGEYRNSFK